MRKFTPYRFMKKVLLIQLRYQSVLRNKNDLFEKNLLTELNVKIDVNQPTNQNRLRGSTIGLRP